MAVLMRVGFTCHEQAGQAHQHEGAHKGRGRPRGTQGARDAFACGGAGGHSRADISATVLRRSKVEPGPRVYAPI